MDDEFATILMDPGWPERGAGKIKRGADRHYRLIVKREDLLATIVQAPVWNPAKDAHLWMWITDNYLPWGMWLFDALGFRPMRTFPWRKRSQGLGQYAWGKHETLYLGIRGKGFVVRTDDKTIKTDYLWDAEQPTHPSGRVIHSAKPERQYELIERRSCGPYLEMFARHSRSGWTSWGDELS